MTPMNGFSGKKESALRYLRLASGISREELASELGLEPDSVAAFEEGCRWMPLCDMVNLSDFFAVGCSALLNDDMQEAAASIGHPIIRDILRQQERRRLRQEYRERIGNEGEEWVTQMERVKLAGTPYANAVNPNYADDPDSHFDILSFTPEGECVYIEVKATVGGDDVPFFMTTAELRFLRKCIDEGRRYELHRVTHVTDPARRLQDVYTAEELLEQFELFPGSYILGKKLEVA